LNKTELIEHVAKQADLSRLSATRAVEAVLSGIAEGLDRDGDVVVAGFGTFSVSHRSAGVGRNPKTGEEVSIKAARLPRFKPGKTLKELLNKE